MKKIEWYGWIPQKKDERDLVRPTKAKTGAYVDLAEGFPFVPWNQGAVGSCVSHAVAAAITFDLLKQGLPVRMISRLFLYYNGRVLENTVNQDSGLEIRDAIKAYNINGAAPEMLWRYNPAELTRKPSPAAYTAAAEFKPVLYQAVEQTEAGIDSTLEDGVPVVFGFTVYASFESYQVARTGIVPMPQPGETVEGGHGVIICGKDDATQQYKVRNSWGYWWGQAGHFWIPKAYVLDPNLAQDFWTIETVK